MSSRFAVREKSTKNSFRHRWQPTGPKTWVCKFCRTERALASRSGSGGHLNGAREFLYKHPSKHNFENTSPDCITPNDTQLGLLDPTRFE